VWQPNKKVQVNKVTKDVRVHQVRKQGKATRRASEDEEWEQLIDIVEHEQTNTSLNTLNRNLLCIAAQPTRRVNNDNQQQQNNQQQQGRPEENQGEPNHATFCPNPRSLHILWHEPEFGVGGRKPAREFTAEERGGVKCTHHGPKVVWDQMSLMIRVGCTAQTACDCMCEVHGVNTTVAQLINRMGVDRRNGGHPALRVQQFLCSQLGGAQTYI